MTWSSFMTISAPRTSQYWFETDCGPAQGIIHCPRASIVTGKSINNCPVMANKSAQRHCSLKLISDRALGLQIKSVVFHPPSLSLQGLVFMMGGCFYVYELFFNQWEVVFMFMSFSLTRGRWFSCLWALFKLLGGSGDNHLSCVVLHHNTVWLGTDGTGTAAYSGYCASGGNVMLPECFCKSTCS